VKCCTLIVVLSVPLPVCVCVCVCVCVYDVVGWTKTVERQLPVLCSLLDQTVARIGYTSVIYAIQAHVRMYHS